MTRSVLVTGAGGQVGWEAAALFGKAGWDVTGVDHAGLDIADRNAVRECVEGLRPDAVVNLAAWNAVDDAEADPDGAMSVNAIAVRHLANACRRTGAHLTHVSSDYVFDGTKPVPEQYDEWDAVNPQSAYGRSKAAGEREAGPDALVVRTSWVCGAQGGNVVKTVLGLAADATRTLAFVTDQRGCPTMAADLAATLVTLVGDNRQYPLAGRDLSNEVRYLARNRDGLDIEPITSCAAWRRALNRGDFDYVVIAPSLFPKLEKGPPPELAWTRDPAATLVRRDQDRFVFGVRDISLFRIDGPLTSPCP